MNCKHTDEVYLVWGGVKYCAGCFIAGQLSMEKLTAKVDEVKNATQLDKKRVREAIEKMGKRR